MNKFISLILAFSILTISGNLMAKEWGRKFTLVKQRTDR